MATNLKAKKKKGTYDNKLILWISIGLVAFVALVVGIFMIITYSTNYVAKVDGLKIYTYEYNYFLRQAISESFEEPEGYDAMTSAEKQKAFDDFFTAEKQKECQAIALEEARKFKAEYRLARASGFKLSSDEKANVKSNIDYYYNMYVSLYGYDSEIAVFYITGGAMTLSEYKDFMILNSTIEKYKNHLKEGHTVTVDEMKEIYDEAPNDYRTLTGRVYKFSLPTKPSVPKDDKGNEIKEDTTDEAEKEKYMEYKTSLEEYKAKIESYKKLAAEIMEAIEKDGMYTLYSRDMVTYEIEKDKDGNEKDPIVKDADFETLCAYSGWTSASDNKGVITVGAGQKSGVDEIDEYILQMQWNEARNGFIFVENKDEDEEDKDKGETEEDPENSAATSSTSDNEEKKDDEKEDEDKVKPSALKLIEVTDDDGNLIGLYLVRVEDINDFDTEPKATEGSDEEALNSVRSGIKATILEDKAVAELEEMVEKAGKKYEVKSKKQERMDEILKKIM